VRRFARGLLTAVCLAAMLVAAGALLVPALLGYQRYVITGGSMTGSIPKGSVIYSRLTPVEALREGDVITFVPPGHTRPVTHRIISVGPDTGGELTFRTKGDFNEAADPWDVHLTDPVQARYSFHIPYLGYALAALAIRQVRMLLIGVPAVIIALSLLVSLWREAGDELEGAPDGRAPSGTEIVLRPIAPFDGMSEAEQRTYRGWWWDG
jgi:signal peptidase